MVPLCAQVLFAHRAHLLLKLVAACSFFSAEFNYTNQFNREQMHWPRMRCVKKRREIEWILLIKRVALGAWLNEHSLVHDVNFHIAVCPKHAQRAKKKSERNTSLMLSALMHLQNGCLFGRKRVKQPFHSGEFEKRKKRTKCAHIHIALIVLTKLN